MSAEERHRDVVVVGGGGGNVEKQRSTFCTSTSSSSTLSGGSKLAVCVQSMAAPYAAGAWALAGRRWSVVICVWLAVAVAVLVKTDRMGPLAGLNFQPHPHPLAPLHGVLAEWPKERESLEGAEVRFSAERGQADVMGPESLEFEADGSGPYTGVADGRVIRWREGRWETFALVSPFWSPSCSSRSSGGGGGVSGGSSEQRCGRPLGLKLDHATGVFYLADAHLGLHSVGRQGGLARPLLLSSSSSSNKEGEEEKRQSSSMSPPVPLFANDLDVHPNGSIFFTDSSARWRRHRYLMSMLEGEGSGRLLRHDPVSSLTHVVLSGLHFPNGVAISGDASYLLVTETSSARVLRVWLRDGPGGRTEGSWDVVADLPGYPDNIRRRQGQGQGQGQGQEEEAESHDQFWVAINGPRTRFQEMCSRSGWLKKLVLTLPLPLPVCMWMFFRPWPRPYPSAALLEVGERSRARVVRVLEERTGRVMQSVSEVQERDGVLWMGSVAHNQITTLRLRNATSLSSSTRI